MKKTKEKKKLSPVYLLRRSFKPVFKAAPFTFIFTIFMLLFTCFAEIATLHVNKLFFDRAAEKAGSGEFIMALLPLLLWVCGIKLFLTLYNMMEQIFWNNFFYERTAMKLSVLMHRKLGRISPILFENKEFNDDIEKAIQGIYSTLSYVDDAISVIAFRIPYIVFMSWYLFSLKPILALSLVFIFVPVFVSQMIMAYIEAHKEDVVGPYRRKMEYYENCLVQKEAFKETRLLGAGHFFRTLYLSVQNLFQAVEWKVIRKTKLCYFFGNVLTLIGYGGVLWMLVDALLAGDITVGAFAAVFSSVENMFDIMESMAARLAQSSENAGRVSNFVRFLDMAEESGEECERQSGEIRLENVSFSYPGRDEKAVDGVDLTIKSGETIAIVGENGAGKSTLVRLMTGIYPPSEGRVIVGGLDTAVAHPRSIRKNMSAVFQKFLRYKLPLRENVAISRGSFDCCDEDINSACEKAGVDISSDSFPRGLDTMLSREFEGTDLSGGEWQRVAIARGLYREHDVIMLDEPTAAIDPVEESRLYSAFAEISRGKTAVLVTHRLGSARIADRIVVMEKGRIAEIGTHDELIAKRGVYAEMFASQAKWYA